LKSILLRNEGICFEANDSSEQTVSKCLDWMASLIDQIIFDCQADNDWLRPVSERHAGWAFNPRTFHWGSVPWIG
jgi:hypothetical protein